MRAIGPRTDLGEGHDPRAAGNRLGVQRVTPGDAVDADEVIGPNTGAELYRAVTGEDPDGASVLSLAIGEAVADADRLLYGSEPGAMGQPIQRRRAVGAVIANADGGLRSGSTSATQAALAMMDEAGRAAGGTVAQLGVVDLASRGGRRMDPEAVLTAFDEAWEGGASAVLVEMSDLEKLPIATACRRPAPRAAGWRRRWPMPMSCSASCSNGSTSIATALVVSPAAPGEPRPAHHVRSRRPGIGNLAWP